MAIAELKPENKEKPQHVEIGIQGSELFVVGDIDNQSNTIFNAQVEHRPGTYTPVMDRADQPIEGQEKVLFVESEKDMWQMHLTGLDPATGTCKNVNFRHRNPKVADEPDKPFVQWNYTLTDGSGPGYQSTNLVFSRAQSYMAPIFKPNANGADMKGRRLIAVEPLNSADYVGTVEPAFKVNEKGIQIVTQPAKHTSPELDGIPTIRAVRASVHKPDYDKLKPIPGAIVHKLKEVDLHPELIASAPTGQKMRVNIIGLEYGQDVNIPDNQTLTPMQEYADTSADGVGFAGFYQLFTEKFADHLGVNEEGVNNTTADYQHDPKESYGKPIRVALIKGKNTWRVVYEDDPKGKFDREGQAIPAKVARNFDPEKIDATPVQVHKLKPVNPNNARETGTHTLDGLHPVEVYVYESSEATRGLKSETLCDFKESGDGPAQMALFEWEAHVYGEVFNRVAIAELNAK